jgi:hypothetical protein
MVAATVSDTCGDVVCSSDTEGCSDSDETDVIVGVSVVVIDCFGVLLLDSAEEGLRLTNGEGEPVVDRLVVLELVKDWLGLEEWLDVLEFVDDALIELDSVEVLDEVVLDVWDTETVEDFELVELSEGPDVSDDMGEEETDGLGDDDSEFVVVTEGNGVSDGLEVSDGLSVTETEAESL